MNKRQILLIACIALLVSISLISFIGIRLKSKEKDVHTLQATVLSNNQEELIIQDKNQVIYTIKADDILADSGDYISLDYTGIIDETSTIQSISVLDYTVSSVAKDQNGIPTDWLDDGIFSDYYIMAYNQLQKMTLDEKIGQLFLVPVPRKNSIEELKKYQFGGYLFFEQDFQDKTKEEVIDMIQSFQKDSKIPLLTAVDEEGGTVIRVSSNQNLADAPFKSSKELYQSGDFDQIRKDTLEKNQVLSSVGLNLNLAPVVDVSTDPNAYMYPRTIGENTEVTKEYAKTVITAGKEGNVSYTLKHFPGYGNNSNTHAGKSIDDRRYDEIQRTDFPPFKAGIEAGAEAVLVNHNTVNSMDNMNPASLSSTVHNILRKELGFTGITITDNLAMYAVSSIDNVAVKAILAGNNLIITSNYEEDIQDVKTAVEKGRISEDHINKLAFRILAWKHYKGLMYGLQK